MSQRNVSHDNPRSIELSAALSHIFATLQPAAVEQFYRSYQLWLLQQQLELLQTQMATLRQQISENEEQMRHVQPSSVALAVLVRLQSHGVNDVALLDRMLARGEEWLDETMQLLDLCEQLGMLHDDYTAWCEHALEGAYNWVASMQAGETPPETIATRVDEREVNVVTTEHITEEMLLQKLMSEQDEETLELAVVHSQHIATTAEDISAISQEEAVSIVEPEEESPLDLPVNDDVVTTQSETGEQHINLPVSDDVTTHAETDEQPVDLSGNEETVCDDTDVQPEVAPLTQETIGQVEMHATQPEVVSGAEEGSEQMEADVVQTEVGLEEIAEQIAIEIAPEELELPSLSSQPKPQADILDRPIEPQADMQNTREDSAVMTATSPRVSTERLQQKRTRKRGLFSFLFSLVSSCILLVAVSFVVGGENPA